MRDIVLRRAVTRDIEVTRQELAALFAGPPVTFQADPPQKSMPAAQTLTTIIGSNGVGKTRILSGIADAFRKLDFVSIRSIFLRRDDGQGVVDLRNASSGELNIAASFIALAAAMEEGSIVLIDEPEISLHPEWQSKYVENLLDAFRGYGGCHFILATHSPLNRAAMEAHFYVGRHTKSL